MKAQTVKHNLTNNIFFALIISACLIMTILILWGVDQDKAFEQDSKLSDEANQLVMKGNLDQAANILGRLLSSHPQSYDLMWRYAFVLGNQGKYKESLDYFQRARNQRPFLINNVQFLIGYGTTLSKLGRYADAERYFLRAKEFNQDPKLNQDLTNTLKDLKSKAK